ncbi:MAG: regulatory protein [Gaiellales bacterium]|jgi:regulatory protein|nr:regulatory protein [Gaiellales bacterium]MDX6545699.1 regulatory protein [Gaiellales bacterium]MDX6551260.1 regulatory protein [Gaiellales bacterium]
MDRVSAISASPRRQQGAFAEVALTSGERLLVSTRRLAGLGLARDDVVDAAMLSALRRASELDRLERRLLRLVAVRARSRAELDGRLQRWQVSAKDREELLERLTAAGLLDDEAFAHQLSGSLMRRRQGSVRAAHEMQRLGVDDERAAAALADHSGADPEIAADVLERRYGSPPYDAATTRRAAGLLARRGFGEDAIRSLLSLGEE